MNGGPDQTGKINDDTHWDVVVIGAGPAGGLSALLLAQAGLRTLLVEAKSFPRSKVCGGCLNGRAWSVLKTQGLTERLTSGGAIPLKSFRLVSKGDSLAWSLENMHAVSRSFLDETIARAAQDAGAYFLTETTARVDDVTAAGDGRLVRLEQRGHVATTVIAKAVVCADGLRHPSLAHQPQFQPVVKRRSRLGLGATFSTEDFAFPPGELRMVVGRQGYVGLTRVEGGLLNVAAAVDRPLLQAHRQQSEAIRSLLAETGQPIPSGLDSAHWTGTMPLTRTSRRLAGERLFLIGDAAGYVEPFTGEGMAWALLGAELVAAFVESAVVQWDRQLAQGWELAWKQKLGHHQWICRLLARLLKSPRLSRWSMKICRMAPRVPESIIHQLCKASM